MRTETFEPEDLPPLYPALRERLGGLNVEGAAILQGNLWLLHRGNESEAATPSPLLGATMPLDAAVEREAEQPG